jgi:hypothetical protein
VVDLGSCRSSGDRTRLIFYLGSEASEPPGFLSVLKRSPLFQIETLLRFPTSLSTLHQLDKRSRFPELSCDGFLAQSRYFLHKEQSRPAICQPLAPGPDVPPHTFNFPAIHPCLHCCQRSEDITANASKGEEPVDRDCSSR